MIFCGWIYASCSSTPANVKEVESILTQPIWYCDRVATQSALDKAKITPYLADLIVKWSKNAEMKCLRNYTFIASFPSQSITIKGTWRINAKGTHIIFRLHRQSQEYELKMVYLEKQRLYIVEKTFGIPVCLKAN